MELFAATLQRFTSQGSGAGLLGLILLCLSASNIYLTLQRGSDRIWWNRPFGFENLPWRLLVRRYLLLRLKSLVLLLLLVLVIGLDQLISNLRLFGSSHLRTWVVATLPRGLQGIGNVSAGVDLSLSLLLGFAASLVFLWMLPSRRIPWRPLIPGALLLSISLTLLNLLLARSLLLLGVRFQAYGVVGGVLVLTLWIWLVGVLLYYGQCLSLVLSRRPRGGDPHPLLSRLSPGKGEDGLPPVCVFVAPLTPSARSLPGALTLACTAIGALVLAGVVVLALAPVLIGVLAVGVWLGASLLLAWLGIEAMAALERWFETDRRFQR